VTEKWKPTKHLTFQPPGTARALRLVKIADSPLISAPTNQVLQKFVVASSFDTRGDRPG
jgi:hypothetical protein